AFSRARRVASEYSSRRLRLAGFRADVEWTVDSVLTTTRAVDSILNDSILHTVGMQTCAIREGGPFGNENRRSAGRHLPPVHLRTPRRYRNHIQSVPYRGRPADAVPLRPALPVRRHGRGDAQGHRPGGSAMDRLQPWRSRRERLDERVAGIVAAGDGRA